MTSIEILKINFLMKLRQIRVFVTRSPCIYKLPSPFAVWTHNGGRKPHTAATRASRRAAGARHTHRVDCADLFRRQKIGTIGTFEGNPPLAVAAVGICQNPIFS